MDKVLIADVAKKYTEYDLIRSNTDLPEFPNFRTELLFAFLRLSPSSVGHSELFSLVTSLAQPDWTRTILFRKRTRITGGKKFTRAN